MSTNIYIYSTNGVGIPWSDSPNLITDVLQQHCLTHALKVSKGFGWWVQPASWETTVFSQQSAGGGENRLLETEKRVKGMITQKGSTRPNWKSFAIHIVAIEGSMR